MEDSEMQGALLQIQTMLQQGDKTFKRTGQDALIPDESLEVIEGATEMLHHQQRVVDEGLTDQNAFRERFDSAENHPGEYPEKIPGAGTENGAQGTTGNGQQGDGICAVPGETAGVECICQETGLPPDGSEVLCTLIPPTLDGSGSGGSGSGDSGSSGSDGSSSGGSGNN